MTDEKAMEVWRAALSAFQAGRFNCDDRAAAAVSREAFEPQAAEIARLTECLTKANGQTEHFERKWYLRGDEIERLREALGHYKSLYCEGNGECVGDFCGKLSDDQCGGCFAARVLLAGKAEQ